MAFLNALCFDGCGRLLSSALPGDTPRIDNGHRNNLSNTCFIAAGCLSSLYSQ
jgi:hypothetical protein